MCSEDGMPSSLAASEHQLLQGIDPFFTQFEFGRLLWSNPCRFARTTWRSIHHSSKNASISGGALRLSVHVERDGFSCQRVRDYLRATTQTEHQMQRALLLDVVVRQTTVEHID